MRGLALAVLLHAYVGWRIAPALPPPWSAVFVTALVVLPAAAYAGFVTRRAPSAAAKALRAWGGMLALGLLSMLLVATLLRDAALLALGIVGGADVATGTAIAVPLLALAAVAIGVVGARSTPRVKRVDVPIDGLPAALHGFSIAQISDLHVGPTIKAPFVRAVVERVNALGADAVAITGDLVDGRVDALRDDVAPLAELRSRHGSYFVTGNHEYYSGAAEWTAHLRTLGVHVLDNAHAVLRHGDAAVAIAGVTDWSAHHFVPSARSDPARALAGAPPDAVRVLLAHQPRSAPAAADAGAQLQLSGHTHGGQFWPWNLFVPLQQPFVAGLHRLRRTWVYVSRGTGYWGPPLRLGAPSEIALLRLVPA